MNLIRNILLVILLIQFLIFLYVKIFDPLKPTLITQQNTNPNIQKQVSLESFVTKSITAIIDGSKELPQSSEYTLWDKEMIDNLNKEIHTFNDKIKKVVHNKMPIEKEKTVLKVEVKVSTSEKVAKYAKEQLGQKYVWGATGPLTFDCSGFTRAVFLCTTGIKIPRVSRNQAKIGKYIKYEELKRGDMVFFDTEKKYSGKVNHVGIYLNKGNFIHASSAKKKVIITNFKKKPFYKNRFLWGRRVVQNPS